MIETTILLYLAEALDVPVLMELPEVPSEEFETFPDEFVIIERIGTHKSNHVVTASFAFQSYSCTSLYNAATLDERVRGAVENMISLAEIGSARLQSNYNFTDIRAKRYRYQCVYDIAYVE